MLTTTNHSRDRAGLTYVYPVLSRRSGGLSIGINLNINNACNWRCVYCQVPDLVRGNAPQVNLEKLAHELRNFLADVMHGDFYQRENVSDEMQTIRDIAISGNGEPTTAHEFDEVVRIIQLVLKEYRLVDKIKCVLITNGSMINRDQVTKGLDRLATINGEVWFKIDSATTTGIATINQVRGSSTSSLKRLKQFTEHCPTWIQSCFFAFDGKQPTEAEINAYINFLRAVVSREIPIQGVMLYGVERQSNQPEANRIKKLPAEWFDELALKLKNLNLNLKINP